MPINGIKCVAFDADNTLYETRSVAQDADMAAMAVLSALCGTKPGVLYSEFKSIVQGIKNSTDPKIRHRRHSYGVLAANHGINDTAIPEQMIEALEKRLMNDLKLVLGVENILRKLVDMGITMFVITEDGRPRTLKKLETLGIGGIFHEVITSDDTGIMKPSPKYYESLLLSYKPEEILVVGDNHEKDLALPEKLGMKTLLVESPVDLQKILND